MISLIKSFERLKEGLNKTKKQLIESLNYIFANKENLDEKDLERVEEILLLSDVGIAATEMIINRIRDRLKKSGQVNSLDLIEILKSELISILEQVNLKQSGVDFNNINLLDNIRPKVITIIGVNGTGKTTSTGKLAYNFKQKKYSVLIAAADTFRAAADEQLNVWAKRADVEIFSSNNSKDPGAVVFEALSYAEKNLIDVVLIDTAGRLHTKIDLMNELTKVNRVINKKIGRDSDEILLVVDATMGQNILSQIENFLKFIPITGIILTKLDGTAKGGVIFQIVNTYKLPIRFVGVGEGLEDLQPFQPTNFVSALIEK